LVVVVVEEGEGVHGVLPMVVGYAMRGGHRKKTHQIIGGLPKMQEKKS